MKQKYVHVLKQFRISPKQGSSHPGIHRNVFILNNMKGWPSVFSIKILITPHLLQKSWKWVVPVHKCCVSTQGNSLLAADRNRYLLWTQISQQNTKVNWFFDEEEEKEENKDAKGRQKFEMEAVPLLQCYIHKHLFGCVQYLQEKRKINNHKITSNVSTTVLFLNISNFNHPCLWINEDTFSLHTSI